MIVYARSNTARKPQYRLRTTIDLDEKTGRKRVHKQAMSDAAIPFIQSFPKKYQYLQQFSLPFAAIPIVSHIDREVVFDYIDAPSYHSRLARAMEAGHAADFRAIIEEFVTLLKSAATTHEAPNAAFHELFGHSIDAPAASLPCGVVDINMDNVLCMPDGSVMLLDYEWVVESPIPYQFVVYRALFYFYNHYAASYNMQKLLPFSDALKLCDIDEGDIENFVRAEYHFQSQVVDQFEALVPSVEHAIEQHMMLPGHVPEEQNYFAQSIAKIKELGDTLIQKNNYIEEAQGTMAQLHSEIDRQQQEMHDQQVALEEAQRRIYDIDRKLFAQEAQIQEMAASKFWKLRGVYLRMRRPLSFIIKKFS